ncbi:MAG: ABC transporter ATP-binding protein/permease [Lentisphaerae bacterium]|nr:ABC transporter ATP-binding protein/permease [Lentisphaerota bacterium]
MSVTSPSVLLRQIPAVLIPAAGRVGITPADCLFCMRGDLAPDGTEREVWLIVSEKLLVSFATDAPDAGPLTGPYEIDKVQRVRSFQTVGSAILQVMLDDYYNHVVRCSNSERELLGRTRIQLERMVNKRPLQLDALAAPSDMVCGACGLPLPGRGAACPRCSQHAGLFRRSLGLMRPYSGSIALLLLMMLAGVALDLLPAQLTRILVDQVITPHEHVEWLVWILLVLVTTYTVRGVLNVLIGRTSSTVGTLITRTLREQLQRKLMSQSVDYYDRHSVGSLMSRVLYDVDYFQGFVAQVAQGFLLNIMIVIGIGAVLFMMSWKLALLVLLPVPFVVVGTIFFWHRIYPRYYRLWDSQSKMAQLLSSLLSGIRLVKTFGQEEREQQRFGQAAGYMRDARRTVETSTATFNPIMAFVFSLGGLLIWYAGGRDVLHDHITLGTLMAFFAYLGMFYGPISAISMFSNWVTGFLSSAQRVFEILDSQVSLPLAANPRRLPELKGAIEFRNVTFGYDPYVPVLKNVSFKVEPGQFIGIVGKSGSGKTTVVNLVCRFYDPQEGEIFIDGINVRELDPNDLHRQVALVLQEPFLFRGSIAENIAYGHPDASPVTIMNAAKSANAHDFICKRTAAYDTRLGERGAGLSGGERQRISIARALLCEPRVLILDEATSSVDTESEQEIQKALAHLSQGRTTIAIAHRLSTLKSANRIFVIEEGRIAEQGTHDELLALPNGIYHKLVKIQTQLTRLEL